IVQTFWAWFFIVVIAFRFIPNRFVTHPVAAFWIPCVQEPWYKLPRRLRLTIGWVCLLGTVFGSAFGFPLTGVRIFSSNVFCFWATSAHRSAVPWPTVIVGLFIQQAIAMFVLKSGAGFHIFKWVALLASDFLSQSTAGAEFFFSAAVVAEEYFFVNTLAAIIFFIAFVQMMYYLGVMQWLLKGFAMVFFKLMNVSGAEAMRMPEVDEPITRGHVTIDRGADNEKNKPANALHAFSQGALFGLIVAGQILANVLTVVSLVACVNGLLTWIGRGFGFHALTLQLILRYIFYPITFFMGVPRNEILPVAQLLATKLIANEFVGYTDLRAIMKSDNPLSQRAFTIASYSLCGFANLGSLGIQVGVLSALAPTQAKVIARSATSAMICGFI
ncbi:predicted protein, partial [Postia placenta Mad-698-R]